MTKSVIDFVCEGAPFEMGRAQGVAEVHRIQDARRMLRHLEAFRLQQPRWLPFALYRQIAERRASGFLGELHDRVPAMRERLDGIAAGAGVRTGTVDLFNAIEPMLSSVGGCTVCPGACSAVAVRGSRSVGGRPLLAHNFDYLPLVQPFYLLRDSRPHDGYRAIEFTTSPLAGAVDGMNETGLAITYDYAFTTDLDAAVSVPISMVVSDTLARCGSVGEAMEFIGATSRVGGALLMICDAAGDIASLELSSGRCVVRRPDDGDDFLFHSNAFSSPSMREVQLPDEAYYDDRAPSPLRGRRLHESSDRRDARLRELLGPQRALTETDLAQLMADHGPDDTPHEYSLCVHSDYWHTTACLQFLPAERRIRVAYSAACEAQYRDIVL